MHRLSPVAILSLLAALGACGGAPVSDTGYRGTWSRGFQEGRSTVAIWTEGDRAAFRWSLRTDDGSWVVKCSWEGDCEEFIGPEKTSAYRFRSWLHPDTQRLMVEVHRELLAGRDKGTRTEWTDELVVEEGGLKLKAFTVERDGRRYEPGSGPVYEFEKVADAVADPPRTLDLKQDAGRSGGDS